jgi:hypothetical protein
MGSNNSHSNGLLTAGGVLSMIAGILEISGGGIMLAFAKQDLVDIPVGLWFFSSYPSIWYGHRIAFDSPWLIIIGGLLLPLGIIAIASGISAIRRRRFGLSLAGAICALPSGICLYLPCEEGI